MQKPKLILKYSWTYNRQFNSNLTEEEFENTVWQEVLSIGRKFENFFRKYKDKILELIPKFSGWRWKELPDKSISVYLVKKEGFCFPDPLTLKIDKDLIQMLVTFVHELSHRNIDLHFPIKNPAEDFMKREVLINEITVEVFKNLELETTRQLNKHLEATKKVYNDTYQPIHVDLHKKSLKEHLEL